MNSVLRYIIIITLSVSAMLIWIACAVVGFICSFSNWAFMYHVTPFIGLIGVICIIHAGIRIYNSNPFDYLESKWQSVVSMLRK